MFYRNAITQKVSQISDLLDSVYNYAKYETDLDGAKAKKEYLQELYQLQDQLQNVINDVEKYRRRTRN